MSLQAISDDLQDVLTEEYLLSGELLDMIGRERQQLLSGDHEGMNQCVASKHQLLDRLQSVTNRRLHLLRREGLNTNPTLPGHWTDSLSEFPALAQQHAQLLDVVQHLREENQILGHMLNRKGHFITRLLDRMRPENATPVYGRNGNHYHEAGTRKLISV
jgi:flagellar biosynthesis/type III secretory pathway chaperone